MTIGKRMNRIISPNSNYPKDGVSYSKDSFVDNQILVFQIKFCGKSPALLRLQFITNIKRDRFLKTCHVFFMK